MNERIRELQKQSSIEQWDPDTGCYRYILNPEKFAELIVRECVSTLQGMHLWQSVNNQNYPNTWHDAVDQGIDVIKEHFGVEE
jgi:hypothetical protein